MGDIVQCAIGISAAVGRVHYIIIRFTAGLQHILFPKKPNFGLTQTEPTLLDNINSTQHL